MSNFCISENTAKGVSLNAAQKIGDILGNALKFCAGGIHCADLPEKEKHSA